VANHLLNEEGPGTFARDQLTWLTYGMVVTFGLAVAAVGPAMPLLRVDLGISRTVGGLHFTAIAAGSVAAGFMVERLTDLWGRGRVFWCGGAGVSAGSLLIAAGWHPVATLSGGLLIGISGAVLLSVSQASLSDRHPFHRTVALTEVNTAMSVGAVLPALLVGVFVGAGAGWRPAFLAPLAVLISLAVLRHGATFPPPARAVKQQDRSQLPATYWLFWAALIPSVAAEWSIGAWGAGYLVDVAGTSEGLASFLMTAFFGAMVAGRFTGSRLARSVRPFPLLLGAAAVGLGGFLTLWAFRSVFPAVVGLLVAGLGISMLFPLLLTLALGTASDRVDVAAARVAIAAGGATLLAPLTVGAIADRAGIRAALGIVPGLFLLVVVLAALGCRSQAARDSSALSHLG